MRLADFIREHMEAILFEWEEFASLQLPAAEKMTPLELRNHASLILEAIAKDISLPQSHSAQREKARGRAPVVAGAPETAAQSHAVMRGLSGFDIDQLVAEFRALRASVLRLWERANEGELRDPDDVIRFNEAIDQALTESVSFYSAQVDRSRFLLLAMVSHDMRSPVNTIQMGASYLARLKAGDDVARASRFLSQASADVCAMLDDLVAFNRAQLGLGLPVSLAPVDLADTFARQVDRLRFANPEHSIELEIEGDVSGTWDARRLQQVLSNLVLNAMKYGQRESPVRVRLSGENEWVRFEVINAGTFAGADVERLFEPLRRGVNSALAPNSDDSLGLGLYIAREIARAHGGRISIEPHPATTVFTVTLPRLPNLAAPVVDTDAAMVGSGTAA